MLAFTIAATAVAIGGVLLATAALTGIEHLLGLAGFACAACADPSNGIDTTGVVGGVFGAGTAAGGAAAGNGETGGVGVGRDDRTVWNPSGPNAFPDDASRGAWHDQHFGPGPGPWEKTLIETSERLETWARTWIPEDLWGEPLGTAPASKS